MTHNAYVRAGAAVLVLVLAAPLWAHWHWGDGPLWAPIVASGIGAALAFTD